MHEYEREREFLREYSAGYSLYCLPRTGATAACWALSERLADHSAACRALHAPSATHHPSPIAHRPSAHPHIRPPPPPLQGPSARSLRRGGGRGGGRRARGADICRPEGWRAGRGEGGAGGRGGAGGAGEGGGDGLDVELRCEISDRVLILLYPPAKRAGGGREGVSRQCRQV